MKQLNRDALWARGRIYIYLFIALILGYTLLSMAPKDDQAQAPANQNLAVFQEAESKWQEGEHVSKKLEAYFKENPKMEFYFNSVLTFALSFIGLGFILNLFWIFSPHWRDRLKREGPVLRQEWPVYYLFKVMSLWILISLALSMVIAFVKNQLFPEMGFNAVAIIHTTFVDISMVCLIVWTVKEAGSRFSDLGFRIRVRDFFNEIKVGILGYAAILPYFCFSLLILVAVAKIFAIEPEPHPLVDVFLDDKPENQLLIIYSIFLAVVVGPIIEEIFFRGFCYPILKRKWGVLAAMVITAAFFALIHQNQFAFLPIFILGLGLAYLFEKRQSLVAPITLHLVHNTFFITYFFLAKKIILGGAS